MYRTLRFLSSIENNCSFDEEGIPVVPGLREVAEMIAAAIASNGVETTVIEQHSFYGWGFGTVFEGFKVWNVLNPVGEECFFIFSMEGIWWKSLFSREPGMAFERYSRFIAASLETVPVASAFEWARTSA